MVRVNIINPRLLTDQHLIAEYNEILMLFGHVSKYPAKQGIPDRYLLGPGHIKFFKDKLLYLKRRHELIKLEMKKRGFVPEKTIDLSKYPKYLRNDWKPSPQDFSIIKTRLLQKLSKKPSWYRYYGEKKTIRFYNGILSSID